MYLIYLLLVYLTL